MHNTIRYEHGQFNVYFEHSDEYDNNKKNERWFVFKVEAIDAQASDRKNNNNTNKL